MNEIIPALLVESEKEFERRLRLIEPHVKTVQVDVLDGIMFPHISWYDARNIGAFLTTVNFELHLMVENPLAVVEEWKEYVPTLTRVIFHAEIDRQHQGLVDAMKELGLEVGMALNPETPISEAHHELSELDELLLMSVHPGASAQGIGDEKHGLTKEDLFEKIISIHKRYPTITLGADGGINLDNIHHFKEAGISRFCVGSAIFNQTDPIKALNDLQRKL
ncbi:MAG: hypothetical protein O2877_02125 [bacterium]|nr:hypothetical protein [bacterium]